VIPRIAEAQADQANLLNRALFDAALINWISVRRFIPVAGYALRFFVGAPSDTPSLDAC
jgi:hypothetical protein